MGDFLEKSKSRLDSAHRWKISEAMVIQQAARKSLTKLLRILSGFVLDYGLSVTEVTLILRTAAVQSAAARQLENSDRVNISGIAAITGIPRGEVSRILNTSGRPTLRPIKGRQNITSKILSAWHSDPDYITANHRPRYLKLFGTGPTFESLVRTHGQGIPIRAILDELKRIGAIQLLTSSQKILPRMSVAINPRITYKKIRNFDTATDDLFLYLLCDSDAQFFENISCIKSWSGSVPIVRKRFARNAIALIRQLQTKLTVKETKHRPEDEQKVAQLSVRIFYRESNAQLAKDSLKGRRNFHRK
jgi:hypothetical protein